MGSTQATDDDDEDDEGEEDEDDDEEEPGSDSGQEEAEADTRGDDLVDAGPSGAGAGDPHHQHGAQPAATAATEDSVLSADGAEEVEGGGTPHGSADERSGHADEEQGEEGEGGEVLSPCGLPAGYIASLVRAQYKRGGEARAPATQPTALTMTCLSPCGP